MLCREVIIWLCIKNAHVTWCVRKCESQGAYRWCFGGSVCMQVCLCSLVFVLQGGIYLVVHKHVGWSICVIYEMVSNCMRLGPRACVSWAWIHIVLQLHKAYTALWCVTDRVMCLGAADAVHIWWEIQPTVCSLIWHGMIQSITRTQRHPLAHTASMLTPPPLRHPESDTGACTHIPTEEDIHACQAQTTPTLRET